MSAGDFWCDPTQRAYAGGRKCAQGYCGGNEAEHEVVTFS